jgi:hypothetical protein
MIEHRHWKRTSKKGIEGQHIAIVGYSHYRDLQAGKDSNEFTHTVMNTYLSGDRRMGAMFFPPIQRYFGYENHRVEFWSRVDFFNFVPECFASTDKFASAARDLKTRSQDRFKKILSVEKPNKVFVFSRKGWNQCPDTVEATQPLNANPKDTWGFYEAGGHKILACGFRHPLFAKIEDMQLAVQEFLKMR